MSVVGYASLNRDAKKQDGRVASMVDTVWALSVDNTLINTY